MSVPHTGVLTGNVGKHNNNSSLGGPADCLLKDLAFLFVFLQSPAGEETHTCRIISINILQTTLRLF